MFRHELEVLAIRASQDLLPSNFAELSQSSIVLRLLGDTTMSLAQLEPGGDVWSEEPAAGNGVVLHFDDSWRLRSLSPYPDGRSGLEVILDTVVPERRRAYHNDTVMAVQFVGGRVLSILQLE